MAEYKDMTTPKEFRSLEIDFEKNIMKLNGDDLNRCTELNLRITPEEVYVETKLFTTFSKKRKITSPENFSYPNEVMDNFR